MDHNLKIKKERFFYEENKRSRRKIFDQSRRQLNLQDASVRYPSSLEARIKAYINDYTHEIELLYEEVITNALFEELFAIDWFIDKPDRSKIISLLEILEDLTYLSAKFVEEIKKINFELFCTYIVLFYSDDVEVFGMLLIIFGNIVNDDETNEEYFLEKKFMYVVDGFLNKIVWQPDPNAVNNYADDQLLDLYKDIRNKLLWFVISFDYNSEGIFTPLILETVLIILNRPEEVSHKDFKAFHAVIKNTSSEILGRYANSINNIIASQLRKPKMQKLLLMSACELLKRHRHVHESEIITLVKNNKNNPKTAVLAGKLSVFAIQYCSEDFTRINLCKEKYFDMYLERVKLTKDKEQFKVSLQNLLYLILFVNDNEFYHLMFNKYCSIEFMTGILASKKNFLDDMEYALILDVIAILVDFLTKEAIVVHKAGMKKLASQVFSLQYHEAESIYVKAYDMLESINNYCKKAYSK